MSKNRKKTGLLWALAVLAVVVAAGLILTAPKHVRIDADVPVGEDVLLTSQGQALAASFLKPAGTTGPVPGVVMIVGSSAYSYRTSWKKDEFPLWKNISEAFLAKGYAVLLLEKKGVNRSEGHWETQSFFDRAEDALAGVHYLKSRSDIDSARVGLCGHSQGGWIVQLAAAEAPADVAFIVCLAGPNISVKQQVIDDQANEWRCSGRPEAKVERKVKWLRTQLDFYGIVSRIVKFGVLGHIINYDPAVENVPARIKCPVLALYGEYDTLVMPKTNRPLLEKGLAAGGNTRATIVVVPGGSHGFVKKTQFCPQKFDGVPPQAPEFFAALANWDPFSY
jgi:dienelactone hydrolase